MVRGSTLFEPLNELNRPTCRLEVLRALVGHIPPHPLWGELLWQRQDELTKRAEGAPDSSRPITQTISPHAPVTNHHR